MRADLQVIGPQANMKRYLVAGGTSIVAGEPVHSVATSSSGIASANTYVLAAVDTPIIGTHRFGGISLENSLNNTAATPVVLEQFLNTANPSPSTGRIRGKAETAANVDTLTELALLLGDMVLIAYDATGASDGAQLYTIHDDATADTSGLELIGGNPATQELEAVLAATAYRWDIS